MAALGVRPASTRGIAFDFRNRIALFIREKIALSEISLKHCFAEKLLFIFAGGRTFARMTSGAILRKYDLAARHDGFVLRDKILATGRVFKPERFEALEKVG